MNLRHFLSKLTDPFPMIVGAATVASGVAFSAPFVAAGGVALWLAAGAAEALRVQRPQASLPWGRWAQTIDQARIPDPLNAQLVRILAAGRQVEEASLQVKIAESEIQADLRDVMVDVLRTADQGHVLQRHLAEWDIGAVKRRAAATTDAMEAQALHEQIAVHDRLDARFDELLQRLSRLEAQLGATRADLLQASVSTALDGDVSGAMAQLKVTARTIADSYSEMETDPLEGFNPG